MIAVPAYGIVKWEEVQQPAWEHQFDASSMENDCVKVTFNEQGELTSIWDKRLEREMLKAPANTLLVYPDVLNYNEQWGIENALDMPIRYMDSEPDRFRLMSARTYGDGPCIIRQHEYEYQDYRLAQRVIPTAGSSKIEFDTHVWWNESCKMLRSRFPVSIRTAKAVGGIQFGCVEHPVSSNTDWEYFMFERVAQGWMDLSQGDCGAALIAPFKYGYRLQDECLDINLLRSSQYPAEHLDQGEHRFSYFFYSHPGTHVEGRVLQAFLESDQPLQIMRGHAQGPFRTNEVKLTGNVILETVKPSEDGLGCVYRLYEPNGRGETVRLQIGQKIPACLSGQYIGGYRVRASIGGWFDRTGVCSL